MIRPSGAPWHIAHVIGALRTGGAERQLVNYLAVADRADFRHSVVCLEDRGDLAATVEGLGIPVVRMDVSKRTLPGDLMRFASWYRSSDVAIVHAHMHDAALWGRLAGIGARVPILMTTEHGKELWKGPSRVAIDHHLSRWTARHIAVARDGMEIRMRRERYAPGKMVLIPNGVPIPDDPVNEAGRQRIRAEFGLRPDDLVLGSVGRVVEAKGYEYLLGALAGLAAEIPAIRWLSVGDGDKRRELEHLSSTLGVASSVIWAGWRGDVTDVLAAIDIWVMSSVREGLPVALLEAMAARRPIVATAVGGIPDAVRDGREGLLVQPADSDALGAAIRRLRVESALAERLSAAAGERAASEYGIESVATRIESVYREEIARIAAQGRRND